ncbi:MAG: SDR family NAD(P)-dependent oxidoreductase [Daejeonella sp.]
MEAITYTLITGASEGFGKAMAFYCASLKMNLVLVALPGPEIHYLAAFIEKNFEVSAMGFEADLGDEKNCFWLYEEVKKKGLSIRYLINNAGVLSRGLFCDLNTDYFLKQIRVNVSAPTLLIKLFLNDLKQNAPSAILNVSSMAGLFHIPKKQVYGGSKAYLLSFSKSLRLELKRDKISVSIVCPGGMNTNPRLIYQNRIGSWMSRKSILDPEEAAKISIDAMLAGKEMIIPGTVNHFIMFIDKLIPKFIKEKIIAAHMK